MSKCIGCGVELQTKDKNALGFTNKIDNNICERCFRIKNYNEYKTITKNPNDYIEKLSSINKNDLVILVVDLFNISNDIEIISKYIKNKILLVLTKRDILPKSCNEQKFVKYFEKYNLNIIDTLVISSKKNYNLDILMDKINKYKTSNRVYVVGYTNSGKSTLINKIIYNYSVLTPSITTSNLPSTTLEPIEVFITSSLTLIDMPGLIDEGDITNYVDAKSLKRIVPKCEVKPKTFQLKGNEKIIIDDLILLELYNKNNITIYMSNEMKIKKVYKSESNLKEMKKYDLKLEPKSDIVIKGIGFIKFTDASNVVLHLKHGKTNSVFIRENLI